MTRRLARLFSAHTLTPAWAVHFHNDGPHGDSAACFDARCGLAPLTVSDRTRFVPAPPSPPAGRPAPRHEPASAVTRRGASPHSLRRRSPSERDRVRKGCEVRDMTEQVVPPRRV